MNRSIILPTLLAALALGLAVYHHVELGRLRAHLAQLAQSPVNARDGAAIELRLRALEARTTRPWSTPASQADHAQPAIDHAAAAPPALYASTGSPADRRLASETTKQLMDAARARSLDHAENRRTWIQALATEARLTPETTAQLAGALETEFLRRADVIAEVRRGARAREDGRAELQRLEAAANERARALLDADRFERYLARRVASGIHDDGSER